MSQMALKFRSEEDARAALEVARARLIADGVRIAVRLCHMHGTCTAQDVWAAMDAEGMLSEGDKALNARWLGVCFVGREGRRLFEPCGFARTGNPSRNAHHAPRTVWRLRAA